MIPGKFRTPTVQFYNTVLLKKTLSSRNCKWYSTCQAILTSHRERSPIFPACLANDLPTFSRDVEMCARPWLLPLWFCTHLGWRLSGSLQVDKSSVVQILVVSTGQLDRLNLMVCRLHWFLYQGCMSFWYRIYSNGKTLALKLPVQAARKTGDWEHNMILCTLKSTPSQTILRSMYSPCSRDLRIISQGL